MVHDIHWQFGEISWHVDTISKLPFTYMHIFAPTGGDSENEEQSEPDKDTSTKRLTAL